MASNRLIWAGVVLAMVLGLAWCASPIDLTVATFVDHTGYIRSGERFGVRVGMDLGEAKRVLAGRGFAQVHPLTQDTVRQCEGRTPFEGEAIVSFLDRSWRNGSVCLMVQQGRVVAIGWALVPLTP